MALGDWHTDRAALLFTALLCMNQWASMRKIAKTRADDHRPLLALHTYLLTHKLLKPVALVVGACAPGFLEESLSNAVPA